MKKRSIGKTATQSTPGGDDSSKSSLAGHVDSPEMIETESHFASFLNHLAGFAWIKDLEGRYVYANSALQELEPYREGWLGRTDAEIWPTETAETFRTHDLRVIVEGKPIETLEQNTVNGRRHVVAVSRFPILDSSGAVILVGGTSVDVTERAITQDRLREYERVVEGLDEMIAVVDRDYRYLLANRAFLDHRGAKREEVVGRFVWEVLDRNVFEQWIKVRFDECLSGNIVKYELTYEYPNIGLRDLAVTYFPIQGLGGVDRVACILHDITEQKSTGIALQEAERKYHEIFQNAGEGIFQSTPEGRYIIANPALVQMHGFASREEFIAARQDISHDVYVDAERRETFKQLISEHGVVRGFEHQMFRKDGTTIWVSVNARAVRDEQGEIRYYEGTSQDISERKRAEARSVAFATLARKLSGARTRLDAGRIIADTADSLFGWDRCDLDLYDAVRAVVRPMLHVDTIDGGRVELPPLVHERKPTPASRKVIAHGPDLILPEEPLLVTGDLRRTSASIMRVPIRNASEVIGLLSIQSYAGHGYDAAALSNLQALADHCGEALNRIDAEESLSESEERFRQMAENIEDILWVANPEFTQVLYVNSAYERIFGRSRESLLGRLESFMDPVHPEDCQAVQQLLEKKREGDLDPFEFRIVQPEGLVRWIFVRIFPIRNTLGEVIRMVGIAQDITESKRAQVELRESEERYRDLVENSHEFICTHDLNGVVLSANRAAAAALGVDLDELVGKGNIRDILAPAFRDQFDEYINQVKTHLATSGLMVVRTNTGEERIWEYYNSLRTEGVAEPIVRGIARDITEQRRAAQALRESEERYRELFENSRDAIYVHDLDGRYVSVNRAAEELSGFTREEILGKHYSRFVTPRHLRDVRKNFCRKLDSPVETTYETAIVCKNGLPKPIEVSSRIIHKDGVAVGIQGTARDITERKRSQEALQTYARRLVDAAEAERQNIARELHDEIGQVLTAVRLSLQQIEKTCETSSCFPQISEGIEVVDEALSRVRELSWELRPSLLDDLGLAAALRWYVARYTERTGINAEVLGASVVRAISPEVEVACFRIIQEALTNTARHSQATETTVYLEPTDRHLRLTVSDNGVGFQTARLRDGLAASALGLRGMQERALAVQGQVEVNSTVGKGTQVIINVPLGRAGKQ